MRGIFHQDTEPSLLSPLHDMMNLASVDVDVEMAVPTDVPSIPKITAESLMLLSINPGFQWDFSRLNVFP